MNSPAFISLDMVHVCVYIFVRAAACLPAGAWGSNSLKSRHGGSLGAASVLPVEIGVMRRASVLPLINVKEAAKK